MDLMKSIVDFTVQVDDLAIDLARPFPCSPDEERSEGHR